METTMHQVRLGLFAPVANSVVEPDICKMVPEGVTVHSTRFCAFNALRMQIVDLAKK